MLKAAHILLVMLFLIEVGAEFGFAEEKPVEIDKFPSVVKRGASSDRVQEVQRTVIRRLNQTSFIELPRDWRVSEIGSLRKEMRVVVTPSMKFRIQGNWNPVIKSKTDGRTIQTGSDTGFYKPDDQKDKDGKTGPKWTRTPVGDEVLGIRLPDKPLHPAGIYGEQTFALVMMFQLSNNLEPTGLLDADTLRRLEPLTPSSAPLDRLPYVLP